jgi:hypothetical protein
MSNLAPWCTRERAADPADVGALAWRGSARPAAILPNASCRAVHRSFRALRSSVGRPPAGAVRGGAFFSCAGTGAALVAIFRGVESQPARALKTSSQR